MTKSYVDFHKAPPAFNSDYRPGMAEAVNKAYAEYCESPDAPKGFGPCPIRRAKYDEICKNLERKFPTIREITCPECGSDDTDRMYIENFAVGEVYYKFCNECQHSWGHG